MIAESPSSGRTHDRIEIGRVRLTTIDALRRHGTPAEVAARILDDWAAAQHSDDVVVVEVVNGLWRCGTSHDRYELPLAAIRYALVVAGPGATVEDGGPGRYIVRRAS